MRPKERLIIAALVTASGGTVMFALNLSPAASLGGPEEWMFLILCAALGAFAGGLACAPLFGRPGRRGAALALLGAVLATAMGASLGAVAALLSDMGALGLFDTVAFGLYAGLVYVGLSILTSPLVGGTWLLVMVGTQLAARQIRAAPRALP